MQIQIVACGGREGVYKGCEHACVRRERGMKVCAGEGEGVR